MSAERRNRRATGPRPNPDTVLTRDDLADLDMDPNAIPIVSEDEGFEDTQDDAAAPSEVADDEEKETAEKPAAPKPAICPRCGAKYAMHKPGDEIRCSNCAHTVVLR